MLVNLDLPGNRTTWDLGWSFSVSPGSQDEVRACTWLHAPRADEHSWVPQFRHQLGDKLDALSRNKWKGTAKENKCPGRHMRKRKYLWDWGSTFNRRKSIENPQLTVPQMLANFPHSTTPTSIHLTREIISWYHMNCNYWWYRSKGMLWEEKLPDPSALWPNTHTPCHNIVPGNHPSSIAEVEMDTAGTWDLSPVVACCDTVRSSFSIWHKKLGRNRWQRSTEASGWPKFEVAALRVLALNIMQHNILLWHSAFANLREQDSVMFPSPSSQLHYKTVSYLLLLILENFLQ